MDAQVYSVELSQPGRRLGAGVVLSRRFALTALHCLRGANGDGHGYTRLRMRLGDGGETVDGHVCERSEETDLALIEIQESVDLPRPVMDRADAGDRWHSPYRPSEVDPYLNGDVDRCDANYQ